MLVTRGFETVRAADRGCAVAVGNFDGLHLGHQAILAALLRCSREQRLPAAVLTFEPHPREFFAPDAAPARLMRLRDKAELMEAMGIGELRVLRFDANLSGWDAAAFIERILDRGMGAKKVVIGEGFRYGRSRSGDVALLRAEGERRGFGVEEVPSQKIGGRRVSSSRVREALAAGKLQDARTLLGRNFRISGRVVAGDRLGRRLGFPTANIRLHRKVSPIAGIFAVRVNGAGADGLPGVASVGTRPTVGGTAWLLEVHLFDFAGELYRKRLAVDFIAKLRDEVRYPDLTAMTAQMVQDGDTARGLLGARE